MRRMKICDLDTQTAARVPRQCVCSSQFSDMRSPMRAARRHWHVGQCSAEGRHL
jgi:hypothetical protein